MNYINWQSVPDGDKKPRKVPFDAVSGRNIDHLDPSNWLDEQTARSRSGGDVHIGVVLPRLDPGQTHVQFLLDLDDAIVDGQPLPWASDILARFAGAWCEVSHSGTGYHVMGFCQPAMLGDRKSKFEHADSGLNKVEFYHSGRFIALGHGATGDMNIDWTAVLDQLVPRQEAQSMSDVGDLNEPPSDYSGPTDDDALMDLMRDDRLRKGGMLALGLHAIDFFDDDLNTLRTRIHNDPKFGRDASKMPPWDFDGSSVDFSLMNHLAYFTGGDVPRMERLHAASHMGKRDKAVNRPQYVREAASGAAGHARAAGRYLNKPTYDSLMRQVQEDPKGSVARVSGDVSRLSAVDRQRFIDECRAYGVKQVMQEAVKQCATQERKAKTEAMGLISDDKGAPIPNMENVRRILTTWPEWEGTYAVSEFDDMIWIKRPALTRLTDAEALRVQGWMQTNMFPHIGVQTVRDAMSASAENNKFHPVRDYLNSVVWDGRARLGRLFIDYFPCASDHEYLTAVSRKFAVGAVARIMQPGCKADAMPTISGRQGQKKSSGLEALVGREWYGDDMPDMTTKDAKDWLRGKWIAEMAELSAMRGKDIEHIKSFLTTTRDSYRKAYGHQTETMPRQTVFAGTTNADEYLSDDTGARRFWPLKLRENAKVQIDAIREDRDQIWAEAVVAYNAGESWWFEEGESETLQSLQENARTVDIDETRVADWLRHTSGDVTSAQVAQCVFHDAPGGKSLSMRVARYLTALGWEKTKTVNGVNSWSRTGRAEHYKPSPASGNVMPLLSGGPNGFGGGRSTL